MSDSAAVATAHSKSCPAISMGGACEPWCSAFPCPSWCTGVHQLAGRAYHLSSGCPSWCAGHRSWDFQRQHAPAVPQPLLPGSNVCAAT
ncbi:MAG TPA: hypothetical protein VIJ82_26435 [Streptosporangiaceae bacterium]|jgi:hypothetical protein